MDKSYDYLFKMILIGDSGVGKSSLLTRYINNEFDLTLKATIGVSFSTKMTEYKGKIISSQIWDTAGIQKYRSMTKSYYRGASAIFIVYDITDPSTFNNIPRWIEQVKQNVQNNPVIMIIGNKSDLNYERKVSTQEGMDIAQMYSCYFIETSALDMINVEEAFIQITHFLYDNMKEQSGIGGSGAQNIVDLQPAFKSQIFQVKKKKKCCF